MPNAPSSAANTVVIVGAGIVGLLTARELVKRRWRVTVIERGELAREASWAGGGILCPLYPWREPQAVWDLAQRSLRLYPTLIDELERGTGVATGYLQSGLRYHDEAESAEARAWVARAGVPAIAQRIEPSGSLPAASRCSFAWVHQVRNPRLCQALIADLRSRGVELAAGEAIERMLVSGNRVAGVATSKRQLPVAQVCICAGAWSADLLAATGWRLPIAPVRGQMLLLRTASPAPDTIVVSRGLYLIPRERDLVLVGSTVEHAGFQSGTTEEARASLLAGAIAIAPALREARVEGHWAGLRPGSPDGVPFVGAHPELVNLWVNAGHYRNGLTLAPASALQLAELIGEA